MSSKFAPEPKGNEPTISRRNWLKFTTGVLLSTMLPSDSEVPVQEKEKATKPVFPKKEIRRPDSREFRPPVDHTFDLEIVFAKGINVLPAHLEMISQAIQQKTDTALSVLETNNPNLPTNIRQVVNIPTFQYEVDPPREGTRTDELIVKANDAIEEALSFWQHPNLTTPHYKFHVVNENDVQSQMRETHSTFPKDKNVTINIGSGAFIRYSGTMEFPNEKQSFALDVRLGIAGKEAGVVGKGDHAGVQVYYDGDTDDFTRTDVRWVLDTTDQDNVETATGPAQEFLHLQLGEFTQAHIRELWAREKALDMKKKRDLMALHLMVEEAVVHAITEMWEMEYLPKKGKNLSESEIQQRLKKQYTGVEFIAKLYRPWGRESARKLITDYTEHHEELFKKLHVPGY